METQQQKLEEEIETLRSKLIEKEAELAELKSHELDEVLTTNVSGLSNDEIVRYSRQIILPDFGGVSGQKKLMQASVLIVGTGGLGCPAAQYLAASGVGTIGLVDYDAVEKSNLHRQILFMERDVGIPKVRSAKANIKKLNSKVKVVKYYRHLDSECAFNVIEKYDVVLDCSDNVATRYLLNDACVIKHKPLVSGSALQYDGQVTVYNYKGGPCYRCLFPVPPPVDCVTSCGDGGVFGPVTGIIGSIQALEALKIILELGDHLNGRLLLFDGMKSVFRDVKIRSKRKDCDVCSENPIITRLMDYEHLCNFRSSDKYFFLPILQADERMLVGEYRNLVLSKTPHLLIDVRSETEFQMCRLPNAVNIPLKLLLEDKGLSDIEASTERDLPIMVVCRRGNDSQIAVQHLRNKFKNSTIKDITGGLHSWHYCVDLNFPLY